MARVIRRLDKAQWQAVKAARAQVAAQRGQGQNVPALRDRLDTVETAIGIVPAANK
jgi:hypothetical protein